MTEHQQGYTGNIGQADFFLFIYFFKQMSMPPWIPNVSRQLFASLWDFLLLLKPMEQKEGRGSKSKQATLMQEDGGAIEEPPKNTCASGSIVV